MLGLSTAPTLRTEVHLNDVRISFHDTANPFQTMTIGPEPENVVLASSGRGVSIRVSNWATETRKCRLIWGEGGPHAVTLSPAGHGDEWDTIVIKPGTYTIAVQGRDETWQEFTFICQSAV